LLALIPVIANPVMLKAAVPVFFRVTVCAALVVSTFWFPKGRLVGERLTLGAVRVTREKPTVEGAQTMASALIAARRIAAFRRACCSALACGQDAFMLRPLPVRVKEPV
jgi:hypothetical protein